ncbi:MAG: acyl-CoA thioesterase [Bacteroidetes bacterium]|nr:acyl-CoA thioesterase [Bacteroidota bacterium]
MFKTQIPLHIRFSDVDAFGHVNNACYLTYIEEARVRYFDEVVDWSYDWSTKGIILAKAEIDFILPIHFKDELYVYTRCSRIGNKSFDLEYQLTRFWEGKEIIMADAVTVMVAFDYTTKNQSKSPMHGERL